MTHSQRKWVEWGISALLVSIVFWQGWIGSNYWRYYPVVLGLGLIFLQVSNATKGND